MANNSEGFANENEIIEYITNRDFTEYNDNIKKFLMFLFDLDLNDNNVVASKIGGQNKADLVLESKGIKKFVSVKKGSGNSVHQENLDVFEDFLRNINITYSTINNLKLYHYGDDTLDGNGVKRYSANEVKRIYYNNINQANAELNFHKNLEKVVNRVLFVGKNKYSLPVEVIYYGTINSGFWATREEIMEYILNQKFNSDGIHFGPLFYQVWGRDNKFISKNPDRRYIMQVKWSTLERDLKRIRAKNNEK